MTAAAIPAAGATDPRRAPWKAPFRPDGRLALARGRVTLSLALAAVSVGLVHSPARAQAVLGRTVAETTDAALAGVFVTLTDEAGRRAGGFLSRPDGGFLIRAPGPGRYVLRGELIGYGSLERPVELVAGDTVRETLRLPLEAVRLEGIVASASRQRDCSLRAEEGEVLNRLWSEARKGLRIAEWVEGRAGLRASGYTYQRVLELRELEVLAETVVPARSLEPKGFTAADPDSIRSEGFIVAAADGGTLYRGADAALLLSDAFLESHCFGLGERAEEGLVGLTFEPVPGRTLPDIRGVLWLDSKTARLHTLEYSYTRYPVNYPIPESRFGGHTAFRHLPGGGVAVDRWWIRMPSLLQGAEADALSAARRCGASACEDGETLRGLSRAGLAIEEEGGQVLSFRLPDGTALPAAEEAAIAGVVLDSTVADSPAPLAGAEVNVRGTELRTVTDARGRFRFDPVPEGTYRLEFRHPRLDELGIERPEPVLARARRGEVVSAQLATPSPSTLAMARCEAPDAGDGSGRPVARAAVRDDGGPVAVLHGVVRDAATGAAVRGARVRLLASSPSPSAQPDAQDGLEVETDAAGMYLFCGIPAEPVLLTADFLGRGRHEVRVVPTSQAPIRVDLDLVLSTPARLLGRVLRAEDDSAAAGVVVRIRETGQSAISDESGRFAFDSVAPGALSLETEHVAFRPSAGVVAVRGGEIVRLELRVAREVFTLAPVVVTARSRALLMDARMRGFFIREARGVGTFIGRERLAEQPAARVTDILRDVPGLRVVHTGGRGTIIRGRQTGGAPVASSISASKNPYCFPMIYLDGSKLTTRTEELSDLHAVITLIDDIPSSEIAGIEVYAGSASVPGEFAGLDTGCGVIAVWTGVSDHPPEGSQ